ncbi:DUF7452 domain-containing protein [Patiriisocius hiemis]|uniref:T9SS type A sorting domain-containing protein n=1 Tax=Patiriisocius hiemis TaxID=3075604 RepID=A0ABU2YDK6_9FLAO|nr:T9SS type A sorting domain-containing protein [Constantimarinum sp. W242]MDT0555842.1 T9SS type A sorting domain-containing protein [Constantimarinum sp. W242]
MKPIFTFFLLLFTTIIFAQDNMFVHTATPANISADASFIDHPLLNNNPTAQLIVSHNWNPPGSTGVYNDNITGVFYSNSQNRWGVYNESGASMLDGSSYNIFIGQSTDITLHIADLANQDTNPIYSILNHPNLNGNPDAQVILTTYYNPNGIRNNHNYGVWYDSADDRWKIYTEDLVDIPLDSAFFVGVGETDAITITHTATAANISGNWTEIDHPLLDNNPDAVLVFTHNWGATGDSSNVILDKTLGVWYTGSKWAIYTEDLSPMPQDIEFDITIYDSPVLGIEDNTIEGFSMYPNPTNNQLNITAKEAISNISIYNVLGQEIATYKGNDVIMNIDVSQLSTGTYIAKVQVGDAVKASKFIKL